MEHYLIQMAYLNNRSFKYEIINGMESEKSLNTTKYY